MRVLHVDVGRERESGRDRVHRLTARLAERPGVELAVAARDGSRVLETADEAGVATVPLPRQPAWWEAGPGARAVARLAREAGRWDLVHVHASRALRAVVVALAASGAATRLVATRRGEGAPRWPALWRRADLVLVVSGAVGDALTAAGIGAASLRVVPGGSDAVAGAGVEREAEVTMAAYREVLGSWRRRRDHARWMERAARASRALPAGPPP